jgi:nucleotide-binding universal stress UspA family protein
MIRSVLVPLDGSPFAEHALPLAVAIARRTRAKLHLVRVHRPPPPPLAADDAKIYLEADLAIRDAEQAYLDEQAERLRAEGRLSVVTEILDPPVADAIADYVQRANLDLVVMTTHGRGPLTRLWIGSVADHLIRTLTVPVLLIRPREGAPVPVPAPGCRILLPLDGSSVGEAAVEPATELAGSLDLGLTLVQVVEPPPLIADGPAVFPVPWADELLETRRRESEDYLQDVADRLRDRGLEVDTVVAVRAAVAEAILELAQADDVALVAVSTHGRGGIQRLLIGSVTDKVVRAAVKPVLVVRPTRRLAARPAARGRPPARTAAPGAGGPRNRTAERGSELQP